MGNKENILPMLIKSNFENLSENDKLESKNGNIKTNWCELNHLKQIVDEAEMPKVKQDALRIQEVISGVPNIWARVLMFKYAIERQENPDMILKNRDDEDSNYYDRLMVEWRALLAVLALHSDKISKKDVYLTFSEQDDYGELDKRKAYEMKGVAGKVLFNNDVFWRCFEWSKGHNSWQYKKNKKDFPILKLQSIFYTPDKSYSTPLLLGATSPYTLVFTSANTAFIPDDLVIDGVYRGGWKDPAREKLNSTQKDKIFFYLKNLRENLKPYGNFIYEYLGKESKHYREAFDNQLLKLHDAIDLYIQDLNHPKQDTKNNVSSVFRFDPPFHLPLNTNISFHFLKEKNKTGKIIFEANYENIPPQFSDEKISLSELFIPNHTPLLYFKPDYGNGAYYDPCAYLIKVNINTEEIPDYIYVVPPLSKTAIRVFHEAGKFTDLFKKDNNDNFISAEYLPRTNEIIVTLKLKLFENMDSPDENYELMHCMTYKIANFDIQQTKGPKNLITWPDIWNTQPGTVEDEYFLYSEIPQSGNGYRAIPLIMGNFGEDTKDAVSFANSNFTYLPYFRDKGFLEINVNDENPLKDTWNGVKLKSFVRNLGDATHNYEIYKSKFPFIGTKITYGQNHDIAGFIIIKAVWEVNQNSPKEPEMGAITIKEIPSNGRPASLSLDFGSNNSCLGIKIDDEIKFLEIKPRIKYLFGEKLPKDVFSERNIIFFSGEPINGFIKSHLQLLMSDVQSFNEITDLVFVPHNVPVKIKADKSNFLKNNYLQTTVNNYLLRNNMKWYYEFEHGRQDNKTLDAYLKYLKKLIQYELRVNNVKSTSFHAAFPSSLDQTRIAAYKQTLLQNFSDMGFDNEESDNPKIIPESVAVANYITANTSAYENEIHVGIDIGGSTTDLLFYFQKQTGNNENIQQLIQESIEFGGNYLVDYIQDDSVEIEKLNRAFQETISGIKNGSNDTVSKLSEMVFTRDNIFYTFNRALDVLGELGKLEEFYLSLQKNESKLVYITLYMSGSILYYVGIFLKYIVDTELDGTQNKMKVTVNVFGKGGNIFDWGIQIKDEVVKKYYQDCISAKLGDQILLVGKKENLFKIDKTNNKKEVAHGLLYFNPSIDTSTKRTSIAGEKLYIRQNLSIGRNHMEGVDEFEECRTIHFYDLNDISFDFDNLNDFVYLFKNVANQLGDRGRLNEILNNRNEYWNIQNTSRGPGLELINGKFVGVVNNQLGYKATPREDIKLFDYKSSIFMLEVIYVMKGLFK